MFSNHVMWEKPARAMGIALVLCSTLAGAAACGAASQPLPEPVRLASGWELQDAAKVADTGDALSRADYQPAGWHKAIVPGTVLTSLVADGVYPDPLYGENNRPDRIPDTLCRTSYWYRNSFTTPAAWSGKRVWLTFHGINYIAEVWVNGHQAGTIKGAFARGSLDVTPYVESGKPNGLAVQVLPPPHPGDTHEKTIATGTGPNGGVTASDGPCFMCTIGWDWIPTIRDRDAGIWQDVELSATGPVVIEDPYITTDLPLPRTDTADVTVQATVRNVTDTPQAGVLAGAVAGASFPQDIALGPNETRTVTFSPATAPSLRLRNPRLWWPNGYGPQNLYALHLSFALKGAISDARDVSFGIRKLAYAIPGSENLALSVNGVPVMAKGGNWGMDEAMKRIPRKRLDAQIHMHQLANYTIIRNWVGQSTSEDFYDLCDQYGILLWDEFFQPNPGDGPNPDDVELYLANVREKLVRFRNHPSIALWCARNEGDPPPNIGEGIQKLITALDPGRLYQPSSTAGRGVNSGGPYRWRTPREFYTFNEAFKTEIGSMSVPTLEAIHAMMPAKDWETINDDWAEHDFCAGAQAGDRYPEMIASRYGPPASLADFVRKSQLANYECFRAIYEGRFAKLFRPATGVITWMSNPAQPSFVWQLYSHDLEPNSSLYGTRKACEPVHIQMNQNDWHVMVINNTPKALNGVKAKTAIYNLDGSLKHSHVTVLDAAPSAATDAGKVAFPEGLSAVHFIKLELRDAEGRLLSDNFYWRAAPEHEDDFTALNTLPLAHVRVLARRHDDAGKCRLEVSVLNTEKVVALMTHLQLRKAGSGQRVLPVFYSDNYFSLLPGEKKQLTVEAAAADLEGDAPLLAVDGWNVELESAYGKGVRIEANTDAQVLPGTVPAAATEPSGNVSINCGGGQLFFQRFGAPPPEGFVGDRYFKGGRKAATNSPVDTSVPKAAPAAAYQTERWGNCTYTIPVKAGSDYTVRLHFAEFKFAAGGRKFNVAINGRRVLADLDIAAEAGKDLALIKDFTSIAPDAAGNIVISLTRGSADEPKLCGIQVLK
jgi:hypothetical protein